MGGRGGSLQSVYLSKVSLQRTKTMPSERAELEVDFQSSEIKTSTKAV